MPVYFCCPGRNSNEPWKHGIQVFAAPFDLPFTPSEVSSSSSSNLVTVTAAGTTATTATATATAPSETEGIDVPTDGAAAVKNPTSATMAGGLPTAATFDDPGDEPTPFQPFRPSITDTALPSSRANTRLTVAPMPGRSTDPAQQQQQQQPIRRIRHAEIVLIDDVCIAYNRYWLRIRWPGNNRAATTAASSSSQHHMNFAGYIAMFPVHANQNRNPIPMDVPLVSMRDPSSISVITAAKTRTTTTNQNSILSLQQGKMSTILLGHARSCLVSVYLNIVFPIHCFSLYPNNNNRDQPYGRMESSRFTT
jgi:hypothetical protein